MSKTQWGAASAHEVCFLCSLILWAFFLAQTLVSSCSQEYSYPVELKLWDQGREWERTGGEGLPHLCSVNHYIQAFLLVSISPGSDPLCLLT